MYKKQESYGTAISMGDVPEPKSIDLLTDIRQAVTFALVDLDHKVSKVVGFGPPVAGTVTGQVNAVDSLPVCLVERIQIERQALHGILADIHELTNRIESRL